MSHVKHACFQLKNPAPGFAHAASTADVVADGGGIVGGRV